MPRTVAADPARRGYSFSYELGEHLDRGLYVLRVYGHDEAGVEHGVEIAATLTAVMPAVAQRQCAFRPFWLLSEPRYLKPLGRMSHEQYHGAAYGSLEFAAASSLPHRRPFGVTVRMLPRQPFRATGSEMRPTGRRSPPDEAAPLRRTRRECRHLSRSAAREMRVGESPGAAGGGPDRRLGTARDVGSVGPG